MTNYKYKTKHEQRVSTYLRKEFIGNYIIKDILRPVTAYSKITRQLLEITGDKNLWLCKWPNLWHHLKNMPLINSDNGDEILETLFKCLIPNYTRKVSLKNPYVRSSYLLIVNEMQNIQNSLIKKKLIYKK
jgi:hypothetical protein